MRFSKNRFLSLYVIFLLIIGYLIIHNISGRFTMYDFAVYYKAATRIISGQNLYQILEDGHAIFKYSPVSAVYFIPFQWLSFPEAKVLYWVLSGAAVCYVLYLVYQVALSGFGHISPSRQNGYFLISFIILGAFIELELHLGQVNIFILMLILLSLVFSMKRKPVMSGLFLSFSIFLKPFGLILLAWYVYRLKYKEVIWFLLFSAILFILPVFFFSSFEVFAEQNRYWFQEILIELGNKQDLLALRNHTLFSVLARYSPLRWVEWTPERTLIYQLAILLLLGGMMAILNRRGKKNKWLPAGEWGLLLCLVPLLAFTNRNLYMFSGLASAILLVRFGELHRISRWIFVAGVLISSFNIIEIWGERFTYMLEDWSFITLGTMMIWLVLYIRTFHFARSLEKPRESIISTSKRP